MKKHTSPIANSCSLFMLVAMLLLQACEPESSPLQEANGVIALQPIGPYSQKRIAFLQAELNSFFEKRVIVLPRKDMPAAFVNYEKGRRYSASGVIEWLKPLRRDSIITVAALTDEDIYVTKRDKSGRIKKPESAYAVWGIFGLGYCPGPSCVISERRLLTGDEQRFRHRLRTVTIHEVGHTLGLPHCPNKGCIMSDANEKMSTVDQSGDDYCGDCNRRIGRRPKPGSVARR